MKKTLLNLSKRKKRIRDLFLLSGIGSVFLAGGIVASIFAINLLNVFDSSQYDFYNAYNLSNTDAKNSNIKYDPGYDIDFRNSNQDGENSPEGYKALENEFIKTKNLSTTDNSSQSQMDAPIAFMHLQDEMFKLFPSYVSKWDQIRDLVMENKKELMKYNEGTLLLGKDGNTKTSGFIHDSSYATNEYVNSMKNNTIPAYQNEYHGPANSIDVVNDIGQLLKYSAPAITFLHKEYAPLTQKYFANSFKNMIGLNSSESGSLIDAVYNRKVTQHTLVSLMYIRTVLTSAEALFKQSVYAPFYFMKDFKNKNIFKSIANEGALLPGYEMSFQNGLLHMEDLLLISMILDGLVYTMNSQASYIFTHPSFWNLSNNWKIFDDAESAFTHYFKTYIYYNDGQPNSQKFPNTTIDPDPSNNLYCKKFAPQIAENVDEFNTYIPKNGLLFNNKIEEGALFMSGKSNTLGQYLQEAFQLFYTPDNNTNNYNYNLFQFWNPSGSLAKKNWL